MSTLNITAKELADLVDLKNNGKIAEAWNFLGSKGDAYAYLAGKIVSSDSNGMSPIAHLFYEMVRSQWQNTVGAGVWGGEVFQGVGKQHLENYLTLMQGAPDLSGNGYTLPTTVQLEASYKDALNRYGLPPITAIDSLFSVLDLAAGNGGGELPRDFSWAQFMDISTGLMGGPRWQSDRIQFNSEVFKDDLDEVTAIVTFGRTLLNTLESYGAGAAAQISSLAPAYWVFKLVDGALDYTMMDFARRQAAQVIFRRMDGSLTTTTIDSLLDAAGNNDRIAFGTLIDRLGKALNVALTASNANPAQIFTNVKILSDWRTTNSQALAISLVDPETMRARAIGSGAEAMAYRYALVELNPFVLTGVDYNPHNINNSLELYTPNGTGQITEQWIHDRTAMLAWKIKYDEGKKDDNDIFDGDKSYEDEWDDGSINGNWDFVDLNIRLDSGAPLNLSIDGDGTSFHDHQVIFGSYRDEVFHGEGESDRLYGGGGADQISGRDGNDYIEGNAGNDTLIGGEGSDTLWGGKGIDTYYADELDTIRDADGKGTVDLNGKKLGFALRKKGETVWKDGNGNTFALSNDRLVVNDSLAIEDFYNGDLGIYLDEEEDPEDSDDPTRRPRPPRYNPSDSLGRWDPLVLDLNGNGQIDAIASTASTTYFDFNGDGISERAGWISPVDGFLALDENVNGVIDGLTELFGSKDVDGFAELAQHDSNSDGKIDGRDTVYGQLRIWRDANSDGISQPNELMQLNALGIECINLATEPVNIALGDNVLTALGSFEQGGSRRLAADIHLAVNFAVTDSNPNRPIDKQPNLDSDIFDLPWLRGYGNVKSLHVAYQENSALRQAAIELAKNDWLHTLRNFDAFLVQWTGLAQAHAQRNVSRSHLTLEDKVWMLETLTGQDVHKSIIERESFGKIQPDPRRNWNDAYIAEQWSNFSLREAISFVIQSEFKDVFRGLSYSISLDRFILTDVTRLQSSVIQHLSGITDVGAAALASIAISRIKQDGVSLDLAAIKAGLAGSPFADSFAMALDGESIIGDGSIGINAPNGRVVWGVAIRSYLYGESGHDILHGGVGNDQLSAGSGNDTLIGGQGDDVLYGGSGNDTYLFEIGSGKDTVFDVGGPSGSIDTVRLAAGISPDQIRVTRDESSLYLNLNDGQDRITLINWFADDAHIIEQIVFNDGTVWNVDQLLARLPSATNEKDVLFGFRGADTINGLLGDDSLSGLAGDDLLLGGGGNDSIHGGDGNDELKGEEGFDLIQGGYGNDTLNGGASSDNLYGGGGNDVLDGGAGDDELVGGGGDDVFIFGHGYGRDRVDTIYGQGAGFDTVRLASGVTSDQVRVTREFSTLYLSLNDGQDRLSLNDWFSFDEGNRSVEQVVFSDGTVWGVDQLLAQLAGPSSGNDFLVGSDLADTINGLAGDDRLRGQAGDDFLQGDAGSDTLEGGTGSDLLDGGSGNDLLDGGLGNDTYLFGPGSGHDIFSDSGASLGNVDTVRLAEGVTPEQLKVAHDGLNLYLSLNNGQDQLTLRQWLQGDGYYVGRVMFWDGTVWSAEQLLARSLLGTDGNDSILGTAEADTIAGLGGDDSVFGSDGEDLLRGGAGHDSVGGGGGNDVLAGDAGNDRISGDLGDDVLDGGAGDDVLEGGLGNDTFLFGPGSGQDRVHDLFGIEGNFDAVQLAEGVTPAIVRVTRDAENFYLSLDGGQDRLTINGWFDNKSVEIGRVKFADGTVWSGAQLLKQLPGPSDGNDSLFSSVAGDSINGLGGDDTLIGNLGHDTLQGDIGNDLLTGGAGNDDLSGGAGSDTLEGGLGDDTYHFGPGAGNDLITDNDASSGNTDTVRIADGVTPDQVKVTRDGSNLFLSLNDGQDRLTIPMLLSPQHKIERVVFGDGTTWNTEQLLARLLIATEGNDSIMGTNAADTINGLGGNDSLRGGDGNDMLRGDAGNDRLDGDGGDDVLDGGAGDDHLYGGYGNDTYLFGPGAGQDLISDFDQVGNLDIVRIANGVTPEQVTVTRDESSLYLSLNGGLDRLTLASWFSDDRYRVEQVVFGNGTVWRADELLARSYATEGNDTLFGTANADTIDGLGGNDLLQGLAGDDVLNGGAGNDILQGGSGNDTYHFGPGAGQDQIQDTDSTPGSIDTVRIANGVTPDQVRVTHDQYSFYLTLNGDQDQLSFWGGYAEGGFGVERVVFGDGTVWTTEQLKQRAFSATEGSDRITGTNTADTIDGLGGDDSLFGLSGNDELRGGAGSDRLFGDSGNDVLNGGAGNDILEGGDGNDTYLFGPGAGLDTVSDWDQTIGKVDVVRLADGVIPSQVRVTRDLFNLHLSLNDGQDRLTLMSWFEGVGNKIEQVLFGDGTVWDVDQLLAQIPGATEGNDLLFGTANSDTITGMAGDDHLNGLAGDDALNGGSGNDTLRGDAGNDVLDGGAGDDVLQGGTGNDTYLFGSGSGQDSIDEPDGTAGNIDTVRLADGITPSQVKVTRGENSLYLSLNDGQDKLTLLFWFTGDAYKIEKVVFGDGTAWSMDQLLAQISAGTEGPDKLYGTDSADTINGLGGADQLYGLNGDDVLNGGDGTDHVSGGYGNDAISGGDGPDNLNGEAGNDVLDGGAGDDYLFGGSGNDTYVFGPGSGHDSVQDLVAGDGDSVRMTGGVTPDQVSVSRDIESLYLSLTVMSRRVTPDDGRDLGCAGPRE